MDQLLQADIFFFITSVFVLALTALVVAGGFYVLKILRDFSEVSARARQMAEEAQGDWRELLQGLRSSRLLSFFLKPRSTPRRRGTKDKAL